MESPHNKSASFKSSCDYSTIAFVIFPMITYPRNKNGHTTKQTIVICQQKYNDTVTPKKSKVKDSTYGGMASVATPLILDVSFYKTPDRTGVEFSE